jgi:hypothetical protein
LASLLGFDRCVSRGRLVDCRSHVRRAFDTRVSTVALSIASLTKGKLGYRMARH